MEQRLAFHSDAYVSLAETTMVNRDFSLRVGGCRWLGPGEATRCSNHFYVEWLMSLDKEVHCAFPGRSFVPGRGVIFVPPGREIRARWTGGQVRTVSCCFSQDVLGAYPELVDTLLAVDGDHLFSLDGDFLKATLSHLRKETLSPGFDSEFMVRSLLLALCAELRRAATGDVPAPEPDGASGAGKIRRLRQILRETDGKLPNAADLARHCGVTPRGLSRLVKDAVGLDLRHYVVRERLARAEALLEDRGIMIKQVAYSCGFASAAAFTAAFHKMTGMTPQQYRSRC